MVRASDELLAELLRIERTPWQNNSHVYRETYAPDAVLIFPVVGRIDRETAVAAILKEKAAGRAWAEVYFDDVVGRWLAKDTAFSSAIALRLAGMTRQLRLRCSAPRFTFGRKKRGE